MLGAAPLGGFVLAGSGAASAGSVDTRAPRTAEVLTVGHTTASFERPIASAAFEQADALVVR